MQTVSPDRVSLVYKCKRCGIEVKEILVNVSGSNREMPLCLNAKCRKYKYDEMELTWVHIDDGLHFPLTAPNGR